MPGSALSRRRKGAPVNKQEQEGINDQSARLSLFERGKALLSGGSAGVRAAESAKQAKAKKRRSALSGR